MKMKEMTDDMKELARTRINNSTFFFDEKVWKVEDYFYINEGETQVSITFSLDEGTLLLHSKVHPELLHVNIALLNINTGERRYFDIKYVFPEWFEPEEETKEPESRPSAETVRAAIETLSMIDKIDEVKDEIVDILKRIAKEGK